MCTVTVVPHENGVRVLCNRDERRTRPLALPPAIHDLGGRRALFPVDPQGGGTWIGVNDADLIVALLNAEKPGDLASERMCWVGRRGEAPRKKKTSRGLIVKELLRCVSLRNAMSAVESLAPHAYEPFRVVMVHRRRVAIATSDGTASLRCTQEPLERPLLFTSSSLGDEVVGPPRHRLFEHMVVRSRAGWLAGQAFFHQHQWPQRPEVSVRMERRDALTVSRTTVDITNRERRVGYEAPLDSSGPEQARECCSLH